MEAETDVMNLDVIQVQEASPINVSHMEAETDVMNLDVKQVHKAKPINVKHMEAENAVPIVSIGLIPELDVQNMMDIVQLVSSVSFRMTNVVRLYIHIQKKLWLEMLSI
jgi:hypothetical protein